MTRHLFCEGASVGMSEMSRPIGSLCLLFLDRMVRPQRLLRDRSTVPVGDVLLRALDRQDVG